MNREIKFRGKTNEMNSWWTYGSLVICDNGDYQIGSCPKYGDIYYRSEVMAETVGQYTGLHDKNGKEIYEGDMVKVFINGIWYTGQIIYEHSGFTIDVTNNKQLEFGRRGIIERFTEVIGNIYENKELLEA